MLHFPEIAAWAAPLVAQHAVVLHLESGRFGKAEAFYPPGAYVDAAGNALEACVLELATGDRFIVEDDVLTEMPGLVVLSPVEVHFLDALAAELNHVVMRAIGAARVTQDGPYPITMESASRLIQLTLQGQLRALEAPAAGVAG